MTTVTEPEKAFARSPATSSPAHSGQVRARRTAQERKRKRSCDGAGSTRAAARTAGAAHSWCEERALPVRPRAPRLPTPSLGPPDVLRPRLQGKPTRRPLGLRNTDRHGHRLKRASGHILRSFQNNRRWWPRAGARGRTGSSVVSLGSGFRQQQRCRPSPRHPHLPRLSLVSSPAGAGGPGRAGRGGHGQGTALGAQVAPLLTASSRRPGGATRSCSCR